MRKVRRIFPALILCFLLVGGPLYAVPDAFQKVVAVSEAFVPLVLLLAQGTDTPLEVGAFAGSVILQTIPNAMMVLAEGADLGQLTRIMRWINFGLDCGIAVGALGIGTAYFTGAFGAGADLRMTGGLYLALSIPAAVAAYADSIPYAIEPAAARQP